MKKRWIAVFMTVVMCLTLIACGGEKKEETTTKSTTKATTAATTAGTTAGTTEATPQVYEPTYGEVELDVWFHVFNDSMPKAMEYYMEQHPNVKINTLSLGFFDLDTKLIPALAGNVAGDVFLCDLQQAVQSLYDEQTPDLSEHLAIRGFDPTLYHDAGMGACTTEDGRIAAIPFSTDVRFLFYNKDHFIEAGLDPEDPPKTWDEVMEYSKKLVKFDEAGTPTRVPFHPSLGNCYPWSIFWNFGAEVMDGETPILNSPEMKQAFQFAWDIQEVCGGYDAYTMFGEATAANSIDTFVMGDISMVVHTDSFATTLTTYGPENNLNWGAAPMPTVDGNEDTMVSWSGGFAVKVSDKGDEDKLNAAIDLAMWMTSLEGQMMINDGAANMMCNKEAFAQVKELYSDLPDSYWNAAELSFEHSRIYEHIPAYPGYLSSAMYNAFNYMLSGIKTIDQALADVEDLIKTEINNWHLMND